MKLIRADRRSPVRTWKYGDSNVSASAAADPPDRAVAVLGHEERAVIRDRDADRAAPHLRGGDHEAGHEILVFADRLAARVEEQPDDPTRRSRFQEPCIVTNALPLYPAGKWSPW